MSIISRPGLLWQFVDAAASMTILPPTYQLSTTTPTTDHWSMERYYAKLWSIDFGTETELDICVATMRYLTRWRRRIFYSMYRNSSSIGWRCIYRRDYSKPRDDWSYGMTTAWNAKSAKSFRHASSCHLPPFSQIQPESEHFPWTGKTRVRQRCFRCSTTVVFTLLETWRNCK